MNGVAYTCDIAPKGICQRSAWTAWLPSPRMHLPAWSSLLDGFLPGPSHHLGVTKHINHTKPWQHVQAAIPHDLIYLSGLSRLHYGPSSVAQCAAAFPVSFAHRNRHLAHPE